ncbi:MAG TPA: ammonium transporter [Marine Group III euryarchaeote]|jgi:Amt family ammonium transporter|uniref:Ammonium transporter n=1 Tax=Marine Group III euryarchaeote TaxID=2173149 RepID=A0A7J4GWN6_9ARCH|nr:ammonium transporter [Marine Group III euryarchaeote]
MAYFSTSFKRLMIFSLGLLTLLNMLHTVKASDITAERNAANIDLLWMLICAILVFMMQAGFMCLESGIIRNKNNINVALKNVSDFGISIVCYWMVGYGFMFGVSKSGFIGFNDFFFDPTGTITSGPAMTFFIFQSMFCATAASIISGSVAERLKFNSYLIITAIVGTILYPVVGHWAWANSDDMFGGDGTTGWLYNLGFTDFAGSTIVHSTGGWIGLSIILIIGPRSGRFIEGKVRKFTPSNLPLSVLGVLLLGFGWHGFNGGSNLILDEAVPGILLNTFLGAAAGIVACLLFWGVQDNIAPAGDLINGLLAGLVAVTASANWITPLGAVIIGAGGGLVAIYATRLLERFELDDPVGAIPVHLAGGIFGTLVLPFFAAEEYLIGNQNLTDYTGNARVNQFIAQLIGIISVGLYTFFGSYILLNVINNYSPLRVNQEDEEIGLNIAEHDSGSDQIDLLNIMQYQYDTGDLSVRGPEDLFTEAGQIGYHYNILMGSLEESDKIMRNQKDDLKIAMDKAQTANKAKSDFLARMSHELRTPLNAIIGYSEMLMEEADDDGLETYSEDLSKINSSGGHLLTLINDILDLSKIEAGKMELFVEEFEYENLLKQIEATAKPLVEKNGNKLIITSKINNLNLKNDQTKVRQILFNMLSNAAKFTDKGTVTLVVKLEKENIRFDVIDTGIGMNKKQLDKVFEEFTQAETSTSKKYGGTGLGLPISKKMTEMMGGHIEVSSEKGKGTTFSIIIPISVKSN